MQKDFHYYCIAILARGAGFNSADALVIATASQYVDDATEGEQIPIQLNGSIVNFDPVLTAYKKLDALQAIDWSAQKRVWIPFHFIPGEPFEPEHTLPYNFITRPGSNFASLLVEKAANEPIQRYKRRLCRIGIALHTYADSWPHQDFSGRKATGENNVEAIHLYEPQEAAWEHLKIENIVFDLLPMMGHAQAGYFPDLAFQQWKFTLVPSPGEISRNNAVMFLEAARNIYDRLSGMEKADPAPPISWSELEPKIWGLLSQSGLQPKYIQALLHSIDRAFQAEASEKRCQLWRQAFSHYFGDLSDQYFYDPTAWREAALTGDVDWDEYTRKDWEVSAPRTVKTGFWDSYWVHFHRAALRQRHLVLERLP